MSHAERVGTCLIWIGMRTTDGYGQAKHQGWHGRAHRLAFLVWKGELKEGELVCHSCDTPLCIEPSHLWAGSNTDNLRDMWSKGRGVISGMHYSRQPDKPRDSFGRFN